MRLARHAIMEILKNWEILRNINCHTGGEQGCRSGESTRLPPMWPGFESRRRRLMWVTFVVGSLVSPREVFLRVLWFYPLLKNQATRDQVDEDHSVDVLPLNHYLFILHLVTKKKCLKSKSKETRQYRVFNKFEDLNEYFIYVFTYLVISRSLRSFPE